MSQSWNYRQQDALRDRAREVIATVESGRRSDSVSVVKAGRSGVALGLYQVDLGQNHTLVDRIVDAARASGAFIDREANEDSNAPRVEAHVRAILKTEYGRKAGPKGDPAFVAQSREAEAWGHKLLQIPDVQELVQRQGEAIVDANIAALRNFCGNAALQAQAFCNSLQGQAEMVSFMHQSGPKHNQAIRDFVGGKTATIGEGSGARQVRLEGNADVTQFREKIRDNTAFGRNERNRPGLKERDRKVDEYYRSHRIDDGSRARINPGRRSDAGADEGQTQTAEAQAPAEPVRNWVVGLEPSPEGGTQIVWGTQDEYEAARAKEDAASAQSAQSTEGTQEQSANRGASLAQPVASRVTWSPNPAELGQAIASVGAHDLPDWARNLLGRDVMTNGTKRAVEGFQRTINDANRPVPFDYRWGFDKRNGRVDIDGDLGPQTRSGFGRAVDTHGEDGFKKLYSLDQFGRYVKALDHGRARIEDLEDSVAGTLGQAQPDAAARVQTSLNKLHDDREEPGERLKIDGWIGPKTTEDFRTTLYRVGADRLNERFERDDFWADEGSI